MSFANSCSEKSRLSTRTLLFTMLGACSNESLADDVFGDASTGYGGSEAVSYTHLDVYKRQTNKTSKVTSYW